MNIDSSAARLTSVDLARTLSRADTTRGRGDFSGSLTRARRDGMFPASPRVRNAPTESAVAAGPVESKPVREETPAATYERAGARGSIVAGGASGLPGDINGDGRVDVFDAAILTGGYAQGKAEADLDQSGGVDEVDATILRTNFGRVSEPEAPAPVRSAPTEGSTPPANADLNGDGRVDVLDFGRLVSSYGTSDPSADLFQDGVVDDVDIAIFKQLMQG
jgi:hypothetical protein